MKNRFLIAGLLLSASAFQTSAQEHCGTVTIADMNWSSASLIANVDQFILEHGYGCDAMLTPGDTIPTSTSMVEKGQPDIAPEIWWNNVKDLMDRGISENRLAVAGHSLTNGGEEGFWVPKYMVDKDPSLQTIKGIIANAALFTNPDNPERSAFYGCPVGWGCQITATNQYRALKLNAAGFDLITPGFGAGLSGSIAHAYQRKQPWFGYYWAPTAILGKYDMVKVEFANESDIAHFRDCISKGECAEPKATMYPAALVQTVTTAKFAQQSPLAFSYLGKRAFTNAQMNQLLAWMEENQADSQAAAEAFFINHKDIWVNWVPADIAANIQHAVDTLVKPIRMNK
ncbi:ABC transporter substrate-binding protein [Shewanella sp. MF05960]|uniref:ABC transporter substrate-binding protein n=1 Tax=Shewanella sp. MF05960 TaxID=3434874 RepID=UPI003D79ABF5